MKAGYFILRILHKQPISKNAVLVLIAALLALGCAKAPKLEAETVPTREVTDDLGRKVKIPLTINRAISLAPNLTENIFAVGAGDKLVGVTTFCDYPIEAKSIQKVGDTLTPNMESIIALRPQIVFVSTASQMEAFSKTLEASGIVVFVTDPNSLEAIYRNLEQLGYIFGTGDQAATVTAQMKSKLAAISEKVQYEPRTRVFVQISRAPLFAAGRESFITEVIERAGAISVTRDLQAAYTRLSNETALAMNPDAIIVPAGAGNDEPHDVFKDSPAVRDGKVIRIKADLLMRPSPRLIDGIEEAARGLHPESFK
jgi:iron complex transport system substrate-binding protein